MLWLCWHNYDLLVAAVLRSNPLPVPPSSSNTGTQKAWNQAMNQAHRDDHDARDHGFRAEVLLKASSLPRASPFWSGP